MIAIAIADSHEIYRKGLSLSLKVEDEFDINVETASFHNLYKKLEKKPCEVLLLTSNINGYGLSNSVSLLRSRFPNLKIIVLANEYEYSSMFNLFKMGINSYLLRISSKSEIVKAIKKITISDYYFQRGTPPMVKNSILKKQFSIDSEFNDREKDIIQYICEDKSNQEIAEKMCLSIRTIEWYRRAILNKMNVKSPVGIIKYAVSNQLYQI